MPTRLLQIVAGILAGLALLAAAALLGWLPGAPAREPDPNVLAASFPAPDLHLTDQRGRAFALEPGDGVAVVFFGYTHCPDVCPLTLASLARAVESLGPEGSSVQVVFVTVDPARDTPERLAEYLASFDPRFVGLTGTEDEIAAASAAWGVYRDVPPAGGTDYAVDHSARSYVVDRDGLVRATFATDVDAEGMARTLRRLLSGE
ncbi:MAG TPA: SCO family protein [Longimicrobiales bacterium]|nr:SCO family protein [Longimicrobiales bacterium]